MQGDVFQAYTANNRLVTSNIYVYTTIRAMNYLTYTDAISYERLYESMMKCKRNVQWKDSTANFVLHTVKRISELSTALQSGTYVQGQPYIFKIATPKPREILSVPFRDRVYQRSLNDNIIYPVMTQSFILDNGACQYGKGNMFARQRLVKQLRRMVNRYGPDFYILQIDIHGFYKNLSHEYVNNLFKQKLDAETYGHVLKILASQYQGDKGYNPGSQMVQIAGVAALNSIDHYIKEQLHIELYERYMDDLILGMRTLMRAQICKECIKQQLAHIGLEFNRKKTQIKHIRNGVDFLGFRFLVTESGKVIQYPLPSKIKNAKRKYKHMIQYSFPNGSISLDSIEESYRDFRTCISEGNSFYSVQRMDEYYLYLWKGAGAHEQRAIKFITNLRASQKRRARRKN